MQLLKSTTSVQFEFAARPWLELRDLLRVAGSAPEAEIQAAPMVIDRPNERRRISLQVRGIGFENERVDSPLHAGNEAVKLLRELASVSNFSEMTSIRHDLIFIEPFALPFHELVGFLKAKYLAPTQIAGASTDIGMMFDTLGEDGVLRHVQLGPMDRGQLGQFVRWPPDSLPDTFLFLALGYQTNIKQSFTEEVLNTFFGDAATWHEEKADAILRELREEV